MRVKSPRLSVTVAEVVEVNPLIKRFRFVRSDGQVMPPFSGGLISSSRWMIKVRGDLILTP